MHACGIRIKGLQLLHAVSYTQDIVSVLLVMSGIAQLVIAACLLVAVSVVETEGIVRLSTIAITNETSALKICPSSSTLDGARRRTRSAIQQVFQNSPCGGLGWTPVVSLNMGNPSQECPSPWVERDTPERSCTAENSNNCIGVTYPVPGTYRRVCGRAYGYSIRSPDAFASGTENINGAYLDGVSVTYGSPRQHIWSFAAGHGVAFGAQSSRCPCANTNQNQAPFPPPFVGDNYFCDNLDNGGELWDAMDCDNACCTFNSPPVFTASLPSPTTDGIEVRICTDQNAGDETIHIRLLDFYIQ